MKARSLKAILRGAAHPNSPGTKGRTPFHRAARDGRVENLLFLLEHGADIHQSDDSGERPLQMAARKGQLLCVRALIQAGADVNHIPPPDKTEYSESALCSAARQGYKEGRTPILEELLRAGADPNTASTARRLPLHAAASCGNVEMVRALLEAGAKVDVFDYTGQLPLHRAVDRHWGNTNVEVVTLLLQAGSDVNAQDKHGIPPISHAIHGCPESLCLLQALLTAGANPNLDGQEWSNQPLALAKALGLEDIIKLLREAGATDSDPSPQDATEQTREPSWTFKTNDGGLIEVESPALTALLASRPDLIEVIDRQLKQKALAMALEVGLDEISKPLRKSGVPNPPGGLAIESTWTIKTDDGETFDLGECSLSYFANDYANVSTLNRVDPADQAVLEDVAANAVLLALSSPYGWKASHHHWRLLDAATSPIALDRLAYLAKRPLASPDGHELDDGPDVLGESYQSAVNRFLELGLFETVKPEEAIARTASVQQLKELARAKGIAVRKSTKDDLIAVLIREVDGSDLVARLQTPTLYQLTSLGHDILGDQLREMQCIIGEQATQLRQLADSPDIRPVLSILLLMMPLEIHIDIRQAASKVGRHLGQIRRILDAKLPKKIAIDPAEASLLKTWGLLVDLNIISSYAWPLKPYLDLPLRYRKKWRTPGDLVNMLFL